MGHGCKFVWTVGSHPRRVNAVQLIESVKSARRVSNAQINAVKRAVDDIEMSYELAALVNASINLAQERHGLPAIDQTVIVGQRHVHHRPDLD